MEKNACALEAVCVSHDQLHLEILFPSGTIHPYSAKRPAGRLRPLFVYSVALDFGILANRKLAKE